MVAVAVAVAVLLVLSHSIWPRALLEPLSSAAAVVLALQLHLFISINKTLAVEQEVKLLIRCSVLLTNLSCSLQSLPLSLFHHTPTSPAAQGFCTPTHLYLFHTANLACVPPQPLWLPLSPVFPLYPLQCTPLVWPLLASTLVVSTAAHLPEDPREAHSVNTQPPLPSPLPPPQHTSALTLCTLM